MSRMNDLQEITGFDFGQRDEHPLIEDQEVHFAELVHDFPVSPVTAGDGEFIEHFGKSNVTDGEEVLTSFDPKGTSEIGLPGAGGAKDDQIVRFANENTSRQ